MSVLKRFNGKPIAHCFSEPWRDQQIAMMRTRIRLRQAYFKTRVALIHDRPDLLPSSSIDTNLPYRCPAYPPGAKYPAMIIATNPAIREAIRGQVLEQIGAANDLAF